MRWVYYGVAAVATVLSALLWYVVLVIYPTSSSVHVATSMPSARTLPVLPVLRAASPVSVDGERFICVAGYVAKQTGDVVETLLVENKPVPCPR